MRAREVVVMLVAACVAACPAPAAAKVRVKAPKAIDAYRQDPRGPVIAPVAVATVVPGGGTVADADGALAAGGTATHLEKPSALADPYVLLDFGRNVSGVLEVDFTASSGAGVEFVPAERRRYLPNPFAPGVGDMMGGASGSDDTADRAVTYTPPAGASRFSTTGVLGAQRWLLVRLADAGSVSIDAVRLRPTHILPGRSGYRGWFLSSDAELNRAWYMSAYTEQLNHPLDPEVILDGAKRDRLVWTGDLVVATPTEMLTTARPQAVVNSLKLIADAQRDDGYLPANRDPRKVAQAFENLTFASYVALWPVSLDILHRYTGDDALLRESLPTLRGAIGWLRARIADDGLFVVRPDEAFNWHPADLPTGRVTDTNAEVYAALRATARIERRVGEPARAAEDEAVAAKLRAAFEATLYDDATGLYKLSDTSSAHPQDATVSAIVEGLASPERATRALTAIRERLWTGIGPLSVDTKTDPGMTQIISPFITSRELLARGRHGDVAGGVELVRRLWGYFLREDPASTAWEKVDPDGEPATYNPNGSLDDVFPAQGMFQRGFASLAHAWSTGPVAFLTGYVLGLRPKAPGYARWIVQPAPSVVSRARGAAPTPHGPLAARWTSTPSRLRVAVHGPRGTRGVVRLPAGRSLRIDGRRAFRTRARVRRVGGDVLIRGLRWGRDHRFTVRR